MEEMALIHNVTKHSILISILVPVYNVESYLAQCIESIINQTYTNLEIILVDDGSTDNSGQICDNFASKDKRINVIHKKNGGLVSARKAGIAKAHGEYIGFVDSDDYIDSNMFEMLLSKILEQDTDFIHSGFFIDRSIICNYNECRVSFCETDKLQFLIKEIFVEPFSMKIMNGVVFKLFKAELIKKVYMQISNEYSYGEDMICFLGCIMECKSLFLYKNAFYHYRIRETSLSHINKLDLCARESLCYIGVSELLKKYGVYNECKKGLEDYYKPRLLNTISEGFANDIKIERYKLGNISCLKGKKIALYGAGLAGQGYYRQISMYTECQIVAWADKKYKKYDSEWTRVLEPCKLKNLKFDLLLIATFKESTAMEIIDELEEMGIENIRSKAVWEKPVKIW